MFCQNCDKEDLKKVIKIEINLYEDYKKVKELVDINLCIGCFIPSLKNSIIDKEFHLDKIIEDALKEGD